MQTYEKETIVEFTTVAGNIRNLIQGYDIKYYPKHNDLIDKVAFRVHLKKPNTPDDKQPMPRYLFIEHHEQLRQLIFDLTTAYFYFRDQKKITLPIPIPLEQLRQERLVDFLIKLKNNQLNIWREGTYK